MKIELEDIYNLSPICDYIKEVDKDFEEYYDTFKDVVFLKDVNKYHNIFSYPYSPLICALLAFYNLDKYIKEKTLIYPLIKYINDNKDTQGLYSFILHNRLEFIRYLLCLNPDLSVYKVTRHIIRIIKIFHEEYIRLEEEEHLREEALPHLIESEESWLDPFTVDKESEISAVLPRHLEHFQGILANY